METEKALRELFARTEPMVIQNTLMRIPDKICAAALAALEPEYRAVLYRMIAESKAARIEEEIRLERRRRTSGDVKAKLVRGFFLYFEQRRSSGLKPYIKPIRPEPKGLRAPRKPHPPEKR